jgi:hypothetical protein
MANGDQDWKYWAIRLGFGIIAILIPVMLGLVALSYSGLQKDISKLEVALKEHTVAGAEIALRQEKKFDELCQRVGDQGAILREHDTLLRLPWVQRKEFYQYHKYDFNQKVKP